MAQKPSIPKGTRDFSPIEMVRRNYIFDTIREVYRIYGFQPIETPAMENLSTLMGKYGDEGDKLLFKVLNSGDFLENIGFDELKKGNSLKLTNRISEKGLRYDLTVPFARFVVQHFGELTFPFKRYQIQPVWRADRPQKGRYREFYQCDADVIGSDSLLNEVDLVQIIDDVFKRLNVRVLIKLNNRKILAGIAEVIGESDRIVDITVAIDKLDKIGIDAVNEELREKGVADAAIVALQPILNLSGSNEDKLNQLLTILATSEKGLKGIEEIQVIIRYLKAFDLSTPVELDLTLARGLNYYTGAIIEVKALDVQIGSICGGGRYDDLTGIFGLKEMSGVGISFGADRIYDVMTQLDVFPTDRIASTKVLFLNFGRDEGEFCLPLLQKVRMSGISAEIYPDIVKIKKQMSYADRKRIPFVVIAGETEIAAKNVKLKDMNSGAQFSVPLIELVPILLTKLEV